MNRYLIIHYIGQYLFISLLLLELLLLYHSNFLIYKQVGPFKIKSDKDTKFHPENSPLLISHFTDTHVNTYNSAYESNFVKCLNASKLYETDVFLHTGDAVDDFCTDHRPKYGDQCSNDFEILNRILTNAKKNYKHMLGNAGNHDMFGIYSFDSPKFHFLKTARQFYDSPPSSEEEFIVSNTKVDAKGTTINFVSINPFRFPTLHPAFMYFAHTWRAFLDRLEKVVSEIPSGESVIFHSHYPLDMFTSVSNPPHSAVSSSGKTAADLIISPRTIAFLSGHAHPSEQAIEHHGAFFVETIGTDIKERPAFNLVSVDNGRAVSHAVSAEDPPACFVTYPVPADQAAGGSFVDDPSASIRLVCRGELRIEVRGDVNGEMQRSRRLKENVYLYEFPLRKLFEEDAGRKSSKPIKHSVSFSGDWSGDLEFFSAGTVPRFWEVKNSGYSKILVFRFALPAIAAFLLYVTWPSSHSNTQPYFSFMQKAGAGDTKNWLLTATGLCLRLKMQRVGKRLRLVMFAATLWPILLPISLIETEGHVGIITSYGVYIGGEFRYSEHGQDFAVYFYIFVVLPAVFACACIGDDLPLFGAGGIEACCSILAGALLVCRYVWFVFLFKSAGPFCEFLSVFTLGVGFLFPYIIFNYYKVYKNRGNRNSEWYAEGIGMTNSFTL